MELLFSSNFWFAVKNVFLRICGSTRTLGWKGDNSWNIRELH